MDMHSFLPQHHLRDLVDDDSRLLLVLNRFKIGFGFGAGTVGRVCDDNGVDCNTFLAVANLVTGREYDYHNISLSALVDYLRESHVYMLEYLLPEIKTSLLNGVRIPGLNDVALLILKFFDDYVEEVREHMEYENNVVFRHVESLLSGVNATGRSIKDLAMKHNGATSKLAELKGLFMQHCSLPNSAVLSRALIDIIACGDDLSSHCEIENKLLVPAVLVLEKKTSTRGKTSADTIDKQSSTPTADADVELLSVREREIVRLAASGLSNKEIADKLCLSFHTVTTYRRNISAKLDIHSTAALTIFAILHKIININEVGFA